MDRIIIMAYFVLKKTNTIYLKYADLGELNPLNTDRYHPTQLKSNQVGSEAQ